MNAKFLNQDTINKFFLPRTPDTQSPGSTVSETKTTKAGASGSPIEIDDEEEMPEHDVEEDPEEIESQASSNKIIENEESHHSNPPETVDISAAQAELAQYLNESKVQVNANKLQQLAPKEKVNSKDISDVVLMKKLWEFWFPESPDPLDPKYEAQSIGESMTSIEKIIGLDRGEQLKVKVLEEKYNDLMKTALQVQTFLGQKATTPPYNILLSKIYDKIYVVLDVIRVYIRLCNVNQTTNSPSGDLALFRFQDIMSTAAGLKVAALKAYAMNEMVKRRYRRYHDDLYEPVMSSEGQMTCAWKKATSIKDFVWGLTSIVGPKSPWSLMANRGTATIKDIIEFFKESKEPYVPYLNPDRHIFSFENGIYLAKEMTFLKWEELSGLQSIREKTPAKHFVGQNFPDPAQFKSWKDIPTPNIDKIVVETQKWSPDLVKWLWVMIGRLLYNIKEFDDWQVVPFFFGRGMTGKSTLIQHVIRLFYDPQDIGVLSNKIEDVFGFSPLVDKFVICGDEILDIGKRWDQALMQGMLSGSSMSLGVKNKAPVIVPAWLPPFVLSGNNQLNYTDNAGSYSRRFIIFEFSVKLPMNSVDGKLASRLFDEIPSIILKANWAYREEAAVNGWASIWNVVCPELIAQRDNLMKSANSLVDFLQSSRVTLDPSHMIPFTKFWSAYLGYCRNTNLVPCKKTSDQYKTPFEDAGVKFEKRMEKLKYKNQCFQRTDWLFGIDLIDDLVNDQPTQVASSTNQLPSANASEVPKSTSSTSTGNKSVSSFFPVIDKQITIVDKEDDILDAEPPNKIRKKQI